MKSDLELVREGSIPSIVRAHRGSKLNAWEIRLQPFPEILKELRADHMVFFELLIVSTARADQGRRYKM